MWVKCNPNPVGRETGDCVIRAIAIATNQSWRETYRDLCRIGEIKGDLPNANWIWGIRNVSTQAIQVQNANIVFDFAGVRQ